MKTSARSGFADTDLTLSVRAHSFGTGIRSDDKWVSRAGAHRNGIVYAIAYVQRSVSGILKPSLSADRTLY